MTSPTISGALAEEAARADDRDARIRAEGFRAGAEAARTACADYLDALGYRELAADFRSVVFRSLANPEDKANG